MKACIEIDYVTLDGCRTQMCAVVKSTLGERWLLVKSCREQVLIISASIAHMNIRKALSGHARQSNVGHSRNVVLEHG